MGKAERSAASWHTGARTRGHLFPGKGGPSGLPGVLAPFAESYESSFVCPFACLFIHLLLQPPFPEMPTPCPPLGGLRSQRTQSRVGLSSWSCEHEADTDTSASVGLSLLDP